MIKARRGIHSLGYEGLIARLLKAYVWPTPLNEVLILGRTDNFHAQLSGTKLLFEEPTENPSKVDSVSNLEFSFSGILKHLRGIASPLIASPKDAMSLKERVSLGQIFLNSDRKIMKHIDNTAPSISNVVATGALLYSHVVLRGMEPSYPLVVAAVNKLRTTIIAAYTLRANFFGENPFALIWVLFIGSLSAEEGSFDGNWFRECLDKVCQSESKRILACLQSLLDSKRLGSPEPFYWMLQDNWIQISSVNTDILWIIHLSRMKENVILLSFDSQWLPDILAKFRLSAASPMSSTISSYWVNIVREIGRWNPVLAWTNSPH